MPRDRIVKLRVNADEERIIRERSELLAVKPATYLRTVATAPIDIFLSELDEHAAQGDDDPKIDLRTMRTEVRPTHRFKDTCVVLSAWDLARIITLLTSMEINTDRAASALEEIARSHDLAHDEEALREVVKHAEGVRDLERGIADMREHIEEVEQCKTLRV